MSLLTIAIVTYNEEKNIRDCIMSCKDIADSILILDNYSTDRTVEIAKELGADVVQSKSHVRDRIAYALRDDVITSDWVLFLDAESLEICVKNTVIILVSMEL